MLVKKNILLFFVIISNVFLIFFYIYKQSRIIQLSYEKQKYESELKAILDEKKIYDQRIQEATTLKKAQNYATQTLKMVPLRLSSIKTLYREQFDDHFST